MFRNGLSCFKIFSMMIFCTCFGSSLYSFSLQSLSPYALTEAMHVRNFGGNEASPYYQEKIHEFLSYQGVKDPEQVKVRRLEVPAQVLQSNSSFKNFVGLSLWTGIWLQESMLEQLSEEERIWVMALEVVQYKLNIALKNELLMQVAPWCSGAANVACLVIGLPLFKSCTTNVSKSLVFAILGLLGARLSLMLYSFFVQKWYQYYKQWDNQASIMTARLLCDHGYSKVFEKHLQILAESCHQNQALQETYTLLATYWNEWRECNSEFKKTGENTEIKEEK